MGTERLPSRIWSRLALAVAAGLLTGVAVGGLASLATGLLAGLAALHLVFVAAGWWAMWPLDAQTTKANARRDDYHPVADELTVVAVSVGALVAFGIMLISGGSARGAADALLGLAAVFLSWASLHLTYAIRYAFHFYQDPHPPKPPIDFNNADDPAYKDFFYFSYNLGMTYQVSDTDVATTDIRAVVLRHCLLSYLFGVVVLAGAINVVVGLASSGG